MAVHATQVAVAREGSDVRFGSLADIASSPHHVRFTPRADFNRWLPHLGFCAGRRALRVARQAGVMSGL